MKLVKQAFLFYKDDKSDKVYEVDLCELTQSGDARYLVNFRYGRRGAALRDGTKTDQPVSIEDAQRIYDSVVVFKINKGYSHKTDIVPQNDDSDLANKEKLTPASTNNEGLVQSCLPAEMLSKILSRLTQLVKEDKFNTSDFKRLVWRIGELEIQGADQLLLSAGSEGDGLLDYCLLWTLGRVGKDSEALYSIFLARRQQSDYEAVKRIAFEAMLRHASDEQRAELLKTVAARLATTLGTIINKEVIQSCLETGSCDDLYKPLCRLIVSEKPQQILALYDLYLLSVSNDSIRQLLIRLLPMVPLQPNAFKSIRYIYKAAEFRNDFQVLGLVSLLMERSKPYVFSTAYTNGYVSLPGTWKSVKISVEAAKKDSRIAWTDHTRHYFRLRTWRNLRRLSQVSHARFVDHALGVLLAFDDATGDRGYSDTRYRSVDDGSRWGSYELVKMEFSDFSPYISFNHLLYENSTRVVAESSGRAWSVNTSAADYRPLTEIALTREDLCPDLWGKRPDALIKLLCESHCLPVHLFAIRALQDNVESYKTITIENLIAFLAKPYDCTVSLAMQLAIQRYNAEKPEVELITAMLGASTLESRDLGRSWLDACKQLLDEHPRSLISILTSPYTDIHLWTRELVQTLGMNAERKQAVVARLFAWMQGLIALETATPQSVNAKTQRASSESLESGDTVLSDAQQAVIAEITWHLTHTFKQQTEIIGLDVIEDLLNHPLSVIKKLAGELLVNHQTPVEKLPAHLLKVLIENTDPELRALGVQLFGQLPVEILVQQSDLVLTYCLGDSSVIRQASYSIISRLATADKVLAGKMIRCLLDELFKKERVDDLHNDLIAAFTNELSKLISTEESDQACVLFDKDLVWRLLIARSHGANKYGGELLKQINPEQFSVRQWSRLGKNPVFSVRSWVWDCYTEYSDRIKQNSVDALRILENSWDDSRSFAIDYFRNNFTQEDWTPETMIGVCDSVLEDVQQLGRELITRFFDDDHGLEYLSKLSQHPSVNVQQFTSSYLTNYAGGSLERIDALAPYFVTVLSHVNKGRVAKARVIEFLHQEAMQSAEIAKITARIFSRQSVTIVLCDHTRYLLAMRDLNDKYPFLELPITKKAVPVRGLTSAEEGSTENVI